MKNKRKKDGIPAAAFMAGLSTAGRIAPAEDSSADTRPKVIVREHWTGERWIETRLKWDGAQYKECK